MLLLLVLDFQQRLGGRIRISSSSSAERVHIHRGCSLHWWPSSNPRIVGEGNDLGALAPITGGAAAGTAKGATCMAAARADA